jgi:CDGSH-type Zn-finger protein
MKILQLKLMLDGPIIVFTDGDNFALCRCGASKNKPYCDGSHAKCDIELPEEIFDGNDE